MNHHGSLLLFVIVTLALLAGYPVAFTLAGVGILSALIGAGLGFFDWQLMQALPSRLFGLLTNPTLLAVPLFIFMGVILEKARIAESLLQALNSNTSNTGFNAGTRSGLGILLIGTLLAASTGIVGATVVTLGLIGLPTLLRNGHSHTTASGLICATGTLGQIIPPSIALVLLADVLSNAYQQAQLSLGQFSPQTLSVGDLFIGAIGPGLLLVVLYAIYIIGISSNQKKPAEPDTPVIHADTFDWSVIWPPIMLIATVLGSILTGIATPTEAAGLGALGALLISSIKKQLSLAHLKDACNTTARTTSMIFMILIGASIFSLVFRGYGGDDSLHQLLTQLPGGLIGATAMVMLIIFLLGFILDFIEITFIIVPIVGPILLMMGLDPIWLGIMIAINLQTSFLTPPFGFALFYLRGVIPSETPTNALYKGVIPFIGLQLMVMIMLCLFPELATWLPEQIYG